MGEPFVRGTKAPNVYVAYARKVRAISQSILGNFGPSTALLEAGLRIAARDGRPSKKRAVLATARKLAVTMMALRKTGSEHQTLSYAA